MASVVWVARFTCAKAVPATVRVVLIGLRGSGKTTLGSLLAKRLHTQFIDLDDVTVADSGQASVTAMFRSVGEPAFRAAECAALDHVLSSPSTSGAVIALGGGTPTAPAARALLESARAAGTIRIILLEAPPETLGARLTNNPGDRPLLAGASFAEEALLLGEARLPMYRTLADAVVSSGGHATASVEMLERAARNSAG
ncbi:MAG: shikimate kinase [Phycisphaerales bacterium]|nr:shikimate kinase [Phycisphaerales bacterium]PHX78480.1 MAG: shikimate kinase [Planctomycetaceae bacterium]